MRKEEFDNCTLYLGDCTQILPELPGGFDALITDPPYSSGGQFKGDRAKRPTEKYVGASMVVYPEFSGDNRDQRSFLIWASLWLGVLLEKANQGAICCVFTDWRQLPTVSDAIQCGGWVWRNIATWWKPGVRMQRGRFSSSAEYIVYGSNGSPIEGERSLQNVLSYPPVSSDDKTHIAEKPIGLLCDLVGLTNPGAVVIDPFMGSGSTGLACANLGRKFIGIELDKHAFESACRKLESAGKQSKLFQAEQVALAI